MAKPEHLEILNKGVKEWNQWRTNNPKVRPELDEVDLVGKDLTGINLWNAILYKANMGSTKLAEANLKHANLG